MMLHLNLQQGSILILVYNYFLFISTEGFTHTLEQQDKLCVGLQVFRRNKKKRNLAFIKIIIYNFAFSPFLLNFTKLPVKHNSSVGNNYNLNERVSKSVVLNMFSPPYPPLRAMLTSL